MEPFQLGVICFETLQSVTTERKVGDDSNQGAKVQHRESLAYKGNKMRKGCHGVKMLSVVDEVEQASL